MLGLLKLVLSWQFLAGVIFMALAETAWLLFCGSTLIWKPKKKK